MALWKQHRGGPVAARRALVLSRATLCLPLFLSRALGDPVELSQRAARRYVISLRSCGVLARLENRPAPNSRRVPSQQAALRCRVTAGSHFPYGNTRKMREEAPTTPSSALLHPHLTSSETSCAMRVTSLLLTSY